MTSAVLNLMAPSRNVRLAVAACACLIASMSLSGPAQALEFRCEIPGDVRFLKVDIPGEERLCEVGVSYQATGERRAMWYADNDTLFCSAKAYALRDKYEDLWGFTCTQWPDRDGIDQLSPSHRAILDQQLKRLISRGENATSPFAVESVRATASTLLNDQPGVLALQYFLTTGDRTELISSDGASWELFATINNLAEKLVTEDAINGAFIQSVNDAGALEITTNVAGDDGQNCRGKQVMLVSGDNALHALTPHRYVCNTIELNAGLMPAKPSANAQNQAPAMDQDAVQ